MIARLLRDEGVVEFVEAARRVKASRPEVRYRPLGAVGSENRTTVDAASVQSWVDAGVVEYLGASPMCAPHIAPVSCVVLPSYREGCRAP